MHLFPTVSSRLARAWLLLVAVLAPVCPAMGGAPVGPSGAAEAAKPVSPASRPAAFDYTHAAFGVILRAAVYGGRVDYDRVRASLPALNTYLEQLAKLPPDQLAAASRDQQLAFWIDAYNAHILHIIATAWPVRSIKDIPDVFTGRPFTVAGQTLTFDRLENEIIRARFKEPRVHFALNCAARGCPPLQPEPFRGDRLEAQLEAAAAAYIRDPRHNRVSMAEKIVSLSKLFEWFGDDFLARYGERAALPGLTPSQTATLNFVGRYLDGPAKTLVQTGSPTIRYLEYDWSINSAR